METNVIDPIQLQAAVKALPVQWQAYAEALVVILTAVTVAATAIGRAIAAIQNEAPILKSVFCGSVHVTAVPAKIFQPKGQSDEAQKLVPVQKPQS